MDEEEIREEDLAWVDKVPPDVEAALKPIPRAMLAALRRRRRGNRPPAE